MKIFQRKREGEKEREREREKEREGERRREKRLIGTISWFTILNDLNKIFNMNLKAKEKKKQDCGAS